MGDLEPGEPEMRVRLAELEGRVARLEKVIARQRAVNEVLLRYKPFWGREFIKALDEALAIE